MGDSSVLIAVMGVTGAGKSSLIRTITQREDIAIGTGLKSHTRNTASYHLIYGGIRYILVDTPGFNDTTRSDREILQEVVEYLSNQYKHKHLLSGIIYLHPISSPRVQGSTMTQIRVFKELCGADFYNNVILGTTFWEQVDIEEAETREEELFSTPSFLGDMKEFGSQTVRISQDREACLKIMETFACKQELVLKVQKDLAKADAKFDSTGAALALSTEFNTLHLEQENNLREARAAAMERETEKSRQLEEEELKKQQEFEAQQKNLQIERKRLRSIQEYEKCEQERKIREAEAEKKEIREESQRKAEAQKKKKKQQEIEAKRIADELQKEREKAELEEQRRRRAEELQALSQRSEALKTHSRQSLRYRGYGIVSTRAKNFGTMLIFDDSSTPGSHVGSRYIPLNFGFKNP